MRAAASRDVRELLAPAEAAEFQTFKAHTRPFPDAKVFVSDKFVLKPVGDKAWFTFRHQKLGRRR